MPHSIPPHPLFYRSTLTQWMIVPSGLKAICKLGTRSRSVFVRPCFHCVHRRPFVCVMAGYDVDYFRLSVKSGFAKTQLQFSLASLKSPVNFSTEGLTLVCNAPCLLFVPQEAADGLFTVLREKFHGMRRSTTNAFLLLNARTISGHDLCSALEETNIMVRDFCRLLSPLPS